MDKNLALETLKSFVENTDNVITKDAILALHPELAESEDERIRKEIISYIKSSSAITNKKWIAYLEKQKTSEKAIRYLKENHSSEKVSDFQAAMNIAVARAYDKGVQDTLEKQKDTYSLNFPKSCSDCPTEIQSIIDKEFGIYGRDENDEPLNKCGDWKKGMVLNGSAIWGLVKLGINWQKEQKSTEWSEDYREEDVQTRFAFYTYKDEYDILYLSNVFVEETSRNKGFGTKILQSAEKVAETIGAISIRLKVKQNSPANAWYRKHGYAYITFEDDYDWLEKTLEYLKPAKARMERGR